MAIKMIVVDMDGTFLNDKKTYNVRRFQQLFQQLQKKKIKFVVASGNQYFQLRSFFPDIYQSIAFIAENGANILLGDQPYYHVKMSEKLVKSTLEIVKQLQPLNLIVCGQKSAYILNSTPITQQKAAVFYYPQLKKLVEWTDLIYENDCFFKFALSFENHEAPKKIAELQIKLENRLLPISSGHGDVDLIIPGINKFHGLELLGKEWSITSSEMATFGDSGNDLEMIQNTTFSYAMENAQDNIKRVARKVIGSNNTESLLDTIELILRNDTSCSH